jgi:hypothetical protein
VVYSLIVPVDKRLCNSSAQPFEACSHFEESPEGPGINEAMVWSLVHGYAALRQMDRLTLPDGQVIPFESILPPMTVRR